jgi:hypothetical protein
VVVAVPGAGGGGFGGPIVGGGGFGAGIGQGFVVVNGQLTPLGGPVDLQTQQTINGLATRLRQLKSHENPADDEQKQIADLTEELRQSLQVEFKQMQKFQLDEMAQLRDRLDNLQKEIVDRNKNRESLLDQRLTDLLSGNAPAGPGQQVLLFQQQLQRLQPIQAAGVAPAPVAQPASPAPPPAQPAPAAPATLEDPVAPPKSHVK